jgi:O-antigen/teichoic acid export membrane protein
MLRVLAKHIGRDAMSEHSEVLRGALVAFVLRVFGAGLSFVMTAFIVRSIGATEAGYFYLGMSLVLMASTIGNRGLEYAILRFVGEATGARAWSTALSTTYSGLRRASTTLCALAATTVIVATPLHWARVINSNVTHVFMIVAAAILFVGVGTLTGYSLQGLRKSAQSVLVFSIITPLCVVIGNTVFAIRSATQMATLYVLATFITVLAGLAMLRKAVPARSESNPRCDEHKLASTGNVFWAGIVANQLLFSNGQLIAGAFLAAKDVTIFAVAQRTVMVISFVLVAINLVVAPRYASAFATNDSAGARRLALLAASISTLLSFPIVAAMWIVPNLIMNIFEPGIGGGLVLAFLAAGQLLTSMGGTFGVLLDMSGDERFHRRVIVASSVGAVVLLVILTPLLGVTGAALAMTIGVGAQNVIQTIRALRILDMRAPKA